MVFCLTEHCSLQCPHCSINASLNGKHAKLRTVEAVVQFALQCNSPMFMVAGGEPTEHPLFFSAFGAILESLKDTSQVVLATNGQFLHNDEFTDKLAKLYRTQPFSIQVSALKGLYPLREETVKAYRTQQHKFVSPSEHHSIGLAENASVIDQLGRAAGRSWDHIHGLTKRRAPNCANMHIVAKQLTDACSLGDVEQALGNVGKFCKPWVGWTGNVHTGESPACTPLGNVLYQSPEDMFKVLTQKDPCGKCSVSMDTYFKIMRTVA